MSLASGVRLGPYEIVGSLGAGGMGEVYRAVDTRLNRTVAIKVLPEALAADPQFRERFDREARAISQLSHPNICTLYDVGEDRGSAFLVMELLAGETLAERLDGSKERPIPVHEALAIATQIADALVAAHRAGIVHRDLKPANVFLVRGSGGVPIAKLLDFGLAKSGGAFSRTSAANVTAPPTRTVPLTAQGSILGTVQYMAPEQLEGAEADERADIWAFGAVLYEMITGRKAFAGSSHASLIAAIMSSEPPPVSTAAPVVPRALDRLIAGCLIKDRDERWQSMRDVRRMLPGVLDADPAAATAPVARARIGVPLLAAVAIAAIAASAAALLLWRRPPAVPATAVRFDVGGPPGSAIPRFTDTRPYFAASPDGTRIAFVEVAPQRRGIWIRQLDRGEPQLVDGTAGAASPFWSPDGRSIAFYGGGALKRKTIDGGPPQTICQTTDAGINGTWNTDDVIVFTDWGARKTFRVPAGGGTPAIVRDDDSIYGFPQFLPDGRHFLFTRYEPKTRMKTAGVAAIDSDAVVEIPGVTSRVEYAGGYLFFRGEGTLLMQPFDPATSRLSGDAKPIAADLHGFDSTAFAAFSTAGSRVVVFQAGPVNNRMVWFDRQGRELESIGPKGDTVSVALSPDGSSLAFGARDPNLGTTNLWIHDLRSTITRRFTTESGTENRPTWSPDGRTIVYAADRDGPPHLVARDVAGGSGDERVVAPPSKAPQTPGSMTPDGRFVLFVDPGAGSNYDVVMIPFDGHGATTAVVKTPNAQEALPRVSPDGKWLAYTSNESGASEVYVRGFPNGGQRWQLSRAGGFNVRWRHDANELYYVEEGRRLMAVDVQRGFDSVAPRVMFTAAAPVPDYDVSPDGTRFLLIVPDPVAEEGRLTAIVNWPSALGR